MERVTRRHPVRDLRRYTGLFNLYPSNAELVGTLAFPPLNSCENIIFFHVSHLLERTDRMVTHSLSDIISTHIFRKSRTVTISPCLPSLHPLPQSSIDQAKLQLCSSE